MKEVACHLGFPTFSALSVSERSSCLKAANPAKASPQIKTVFQARVVVTQPSVRKVSYCHCLGTSVLFLLRWRYTDRRSLQRLESSSEGAGDPAREAEGEAEGGDGASRLPRRDSRRHGRLLPGCLAPPGAPPGFPPPRGGGAGAAACVRPEQPAAAARLPTLPPQPGGRAPCRAALTAANGRDNGPRNGRAARPRPHRGLPAPWPSTACAAGSGPALDSAPRPAPASHWLAAAAGSRGLLAIGRAGCRSAEREAGPGGRGPCRAVTRCGAWPRRLGGAGRRRWVGRGVARGAGRGAGLPAERGRGERGGGGARRGEAGEQRVPLCRQPASGWERAAAPRRQRDGTGQPGTGRGSAAQHGAGQAGPGRRGSRTDPAVGARGASGGSRQRSAGGSSPAAAAAAAEPAGRAAPPPFPPQSTPATPALLLLLLLLLTPLDTARETLRRRRRRRRRLLRGEGSARRAERREAADLRAWRPPSPRGAPRMRLKPGALLRLYSLCGILMQDGAAAGGGSTALGEQSK
ncbi:cell adhesion molecule 2 isoform X5 [Anas platyrhynchos]|uniref:cell adhesion molecule 2 isoform X5 n=1 Tax=Anas platyrhynchos TaxID=8839 RepID=UPI003AF2B5FC